MRPVGRPPKYAPAPASDLNSHQTGLVTLIFDLTTLELFLMTQNVRYGTTTFLPILVFLRLFVVELANRHQNDDMTLLP